MPFKICQCSNLNCNLRIPVDTEIHLGTYCPRCGSIMEKFPHPRQAFQKATPPSDKSSCMHVLIDNIRSVHNIGSIFRTADGAGVSQIYLCGLTPNPVDNPSIAKTALGAEKNLPWSTHPNAWHLARMLHKEGYYLVALEQAPAAIPLSKFDLAKLKNRAFVLIIGHERAGVDPEILKICNQIISLPMRGKKNSLNVSVAFGIAAYWLSQS